MVHLEAEIRKPGHQCVLPRISRD